MARMEDLHAAGREALEALECPVFEDRPWVAPEPLSQRKVALISSAGLIKRGDRPFRGGDAGYRTFPSSVKDEDIMLSHISVNFDRTMAFRDLGGIFPRQMMRDLAGNELFVHGRDRSCKNGAGGQRVSRLAEG